MSRLLLLVVIVAVVALAACGGGSQGAAGGSTSGSSAPAGNADNGKKLFEQSTIGKTNDAGCSTCHSTEPGKVLVGPSLGHIATDAAQIVKSSDYKGKATDAAGYIQESIVDPNAYVVKGFSPGIMPQTFGKDLSAQEISDLVAYLMTLK
jgi:nitric oxide reductase subunit C